MTNPEKQSAAYPFEESDKANPENRIIREEMERNEAIKGLEIIIDSLIKTGRLTEKDIEKTLENARNREGMGRQRGSIRNDH